MINSIKSFLFTDIRLSSEVQASPFILILRSISLLFVGAWLSVYPIYLLIIYMQEEKFFSYDIFTDGILGIKSFIVIVAILIIMTSLALWGFVIPLVRYIKYKEKSTLALLIILGIFCPLAHLSIIVLNPNLHYSRILWLSCLSLIFITALAVFLLNPLRNLITNWWAPLIAVALSAVIPLFSTEVVTDIVRTGLENFKVGGNVDAKVYNTNNSKTIMEGKLLLITPNYVYLRNGDKGHIVIARSDQNYVSID